MGEEGRALKELAMGTPLVRAAVGDLHRMRCGKVWEGVGRCGKVWGGVGRCGKVLRLCFEAWGWFKP